MGSWLKQNFTGWTAAFLSADMGLGKGMRLSPRNKYPLFNGNLDCRLFVLELVAGSNRRK
jgi:putative N6-adenine-specific DNA methylase